MTDFRRGRRGTGPQNRERTTVPKLPAPEGAPRLVLGLQPVRAAIRAHGAALGQVLIESDETPRLQALGRFAQDQGVSQVDVVGRPALDRLSEGVLHQGAAAWAPELVFADPDVLLADPGLLGVVLDRIQDPQNFGAVLRSSVGLGATAVFWGEHSSAPLGPATLRAAAGAAEFARLCRVASLPGLLNQAAALGVSVVGLDAQADRALSECELQGPSLLVIGSEQDGMTPAVRRACGKFGRLVVPGPIESLNASVAAAVAIYEATRQRLIPNS